MIAALALLLGSAQVSAPMPVCKDRISEVSLSPDGSLIAVASVDKNAYVVKLSDGSVTATLSGHTSPVNDVSWSPDGKRLVTASNDKTVRIWGVDGSAIKTISHADAWGMSGDFSPDGKTLCATFADGLIRFYDGASYAAKGEVRQVSPAVKQVRFDRTGTIVAAVGGTSNSGVTFIDVAGKKIKSTSQDFRADMAFVSYSRDGKYALGSSTGNPPHLVLMDAKTGAKIHDYNSYCVDGQVHPDGKRIIVMGADGNLRIFTIDTKQRTYFSNPIMQVMPGIDKMTLSHDGEMVIVGGRLSDGSFGLVTLPTSSLSG